MSIFDFNLDCYGLSDIGLIRTNNEDIWTSLENYGFFAIADGMGGHKSGEVAAKEAITFVRSSIEEFFLFLQKNCTLVELSALFKLSIENANSWVYGLGQKREEFHGMGTTLCTLLFHKNSIIYSHVGDSRIYRYRRKNLQQLTSDHSLKNKLISKGKFVDRSNREFPYKNVLTRAIGTHSDVEVKTHIAPVNVNDVYLMCSDGLTDFVSNEDISQALSHGQSIKETTQSLIEQAKKKGGCDNITVVMIKVSAN